MKVSDTYGEPIIYEYPNAVVKVFRPILTPEERERRMKIIHDAAAELLRSKEQNLSNSRNATKGD